LHSLAFKTAWEADIEWKIIRQHSVMVTSC
jgi:hypothetical protein